MGNEDSAPQMSSTADTESLKSNGLFIGKSMDFEGVTNITDSFEGDSAFSGLSHEWSTGEAGEGWFLVDIELSEGVPTFLEEEVWCCGVFEGDKGTGEVWCGNDGVDFGGTEADEISF